MTRCHRGSHPDRFRVASDKPHLGRSLDDIKHHLDLFLRP